MKNFKEYMSEMAKNLGNLSSNLRFYSFYRKKLYDDMLDEPIHKENGNIVTHKRLISHENIPATQYITLDKNKKEAVHNSIIIRHNPTKQFPFVHEENKVIERVKTDQLPAKFVEDLTYDHFAKSNIPFRSSDEQTPKGNNFWHSLTKRALNDGHHVYYHDGNVLHKSNKDNIDQHLNLYFGKTEEHTNKHMILSKQLLENKND